MERNEEILPKVYICRWYLLIYIILGSQKFQFNRLLRQVDKLIEKGSITSKVIAQIGYSDYIPKNYSFKEFFDKDEFTEIVNKSDIIITHGGTGSIITSIKKGKKVIGIPRDVKYGEHVDNHQYEIIEQFSNLKLIYGIYKIEDLENALKEITNFEFKKYKSNTNKFIQTLDEYINKV